MAKIISIGNDVYEKLREMKGNDSYTVVIRKLLNKRSNKEDILKFAGKVEFDEEKFKDLKDSLEQQFNESRRLEGLIKTTLSRASET